MPIKIFLRCPRPAGNFTLLVSFFPRLERNASPLEKQLLRWNLSFSLPWTSSIPTRIFREIYQRLEAIVSNKISQGRKKEKE